jgi:magnesium transporter
MQTFSTIILQYYSALLVKFLIFFNGMIQSTGGNTSSQTSAIVIQGMSSGDLSNSNMIRFFKREFYMAISIGISLGMISFIRIYITHPGNILGNIAVSLSLSVVVIVSVLLGSLIPFILKKIGMDPAFAAGPFLATIMDILGLLIYCFISQLVLQG